MADNTIVLKGLNVAGQRREGEAATGQTPLPGHLLDRNASGELIVHAGLGLRASRLFAVENDMVGDGIDDAYAAGDRVQYHAAVPGDVIYAVLADAQSVDPTDWLVSNGDGTLIAATTEVNDETLVARALETVVTSGATARIKVEVV